MTIRKKILLLLIGFSLIPLILVTFITLSDHIKTTENLHINRLHSIAEVSANAFSEIVGYRKDELALLSSSWGIRDYISNVENHAGDAVLSNSLSEITNYFNIYIDSLKTFDGLVLLDADGTVVTSFHPELVGMDLSHMDYYQRIVENSEKGYIYLSKVHESLFYEPTNPDTKELGISTALLDSKGNLAGVLVAFLDSNILAEFSHSISFGNTGLSFVIDTENYILYHPEPRFYNSYTSAPGLANLWNRYKNGEVPKSHIIYSSMDGISRIYYYEIMEDIELILILRQDYSEFSADRTKAIYTTFAALFITVFIIFFLGYYFANSFTKPLRKLKKAFTSGNQTGKYTLCQLDSHDEFQDLANGYNVMIQNLEKQFLLLKKEKEKNENFLLYDRLTKLYNRYAFEQELTKRLARNIPYGVLFLDIDDFKQINDIYGRPSGDVVLMDFSQRLLRSRGNFDLASHIGGDEFILAKAGTSDEVQEALKLLYEELSVPFTVGEIDINLTVSYGVSCYPEHGVSVDTLITNADISMYKAKASGKNTFQFFTNEMRVELERYNSIIQTLRNCIETREIFLMYQPVYDSKTLRIQGFESLMRIKSHEFGLISPIEFIPIAEYEKNTIIRLGNWALNTAVSFLRTLIDEKNFDGYISVNISMIQLCQEGFENQIIDLLVRQNLPPRQLQLEISKGASIEMLDSHLKKLFLLHEYGVRIALDDFSAHYSWQYYLSHLPLDVIKLDQPFFADIDKDEQIAHINKYMINLFHRFKMSVTAEGVETQPVFDLLSTYGCDSIQGFLLSQPLMEDSVMGIL